MVTAGQSTEFHGSKEDCSSPSYGVPTGQGNNEIFPRDGELPQHVQCYVCTPLCTISALTHQAVDHKPSKEHFEHFNKLKVEVSKMGALPYFDVNAETTLQMDVSKKGLGACLIQKGEIICFASHFLTKTEQSYQNLKGEALGTIWGMEKFHYFLYGKKFTLETNQKPCVSIYKKHMIDISPRVQRLIVMSFPYLCFKVVCNKGVG